MPRTWQLPDGTRVEAPDHWTLDDVLAVQRAGLLRPKSLSQEITDYLTETRSRRRTRGVIQETLNPFVEAAHTFTERPRTPFDALVPWRQALSVLGAPFAAVGSATETTAEALAGQSTPATRLAGLAAEMLVPVGTIGKVAQGLRRLLPARKSLAPPPPPPPPPAPATPDVPPIRTPSTQELLELARRAITPALAEPERGAERLLRQTSGLDVGGRRPHLTDTAEELLLRKHYGPVEPRPLYRPPEVRPKEFTQRELEAASPTPPPKRAPEPPRQGEPPTTPSTPQPATDREPLAYRLGQRLSQAKDTPAGFPLKVATGLYSKALAPLVSRLEQFGPVGKELARLEGRKTAEAAFLFRDVFEPLYRALRKGLRNEDEMEHFIQVVEAGIAPANARIAELASHWRQVFGPDGLVINAFRQAGIQINPREFFFPREFSPEVRRALLAHKEARRDLVRHIAEQHGISLRQAAEAVRELLGPRQVLGVDRRTAAEFARTLDLPDYIRDPAQVVAQRGWAVANRLAELAVYGPKDANVVALIDQAPPHMVRPLRQLFTLTLRRDPVEAGLAEWARKAMTVQAFTKLPNAFIANLGQFSLGILRSTLRTAALGLLRALRHPEEAHHVGLAADMIARRSYLDLVGGVAGDAVRWVLGPYNATEHFVRAVAANQGAVWAHKLEQQLARMGLTPALRRELERLWFSPDEIQRLAATRQFTPQDRRLAQFAFADQIVFLPRNARRSEAVLRHPEAAVVLQFKNFLGNASHALKTALLHEARRGNVQPLARVLEMVGAGALLGEVLADLRTYVTGSPRPVLDPQRPSTVAYRLLDNIATLGAFAVATDLLRQAEIFGPDALVKWLAGPTLSDLGQLGWRAYGLGRAAVHGQPEELKRQLIELSRFGVRQVPFVGPGLSRYLIPSTTNPPPFPYTLWDALGISKQRLDYERYKDALRQRRRD